MAGKTKSKAVTAKKKPVKRVRKTIPSTEFKFFADGAKEIFVAGDFNNWESDSKDHRMRKYKDNVWKKKLKLKTGRYEYQFVVDGQWCIDPENQNRQPNPYCTENSVLIVP